jgi:hypothetical protein
VLGWLLVHDQTYFLTESGIWEHKQIRSICPWEQFVKFWILLKIWTVNTTKHKNYALHFEFKSVRSEPSTN